MSYEEDITRQWLHRVIIGLNLCPFVRIGFNEPEMMILESYGLNDFEASFSLFDDCRTTEYHALYIYPDCELNFSDFFALSKAYQSHIDEIGIKAEIVCFHPDFVFDGEDELSRINYVNRSPFPTLHIIETSLMQSALADKDLNFGEMISIGNNDKLKKMSESEFYSQVVEYSKYFWKGL